MNSEFIGRFQVELKNLLRVWRAPLLVFRITINGPKSLRRSPIVLKNSFVEDMKRLASGVPRVLISALTALVAGYLAVAGRKFCIGLAHNRRIPW